ncbi:ABC-2 type transport system ATP-binding protein [Pullulanibacillus pueri]|uniref:ABC transporter ATP-binding protein n=1 Tax=Pullulanibacillus pueri TaxID=1437324 RepID=A0A8J2ZSU3_9BACL|nr:ABC transporter ATP-binding protein [Pullulanibacillus pueri]MBM7681832.1 ABC-2 type transport system ATP-binding protein [Pullulanibacillus pueri]GGH76264.1 ABC transporter ATP-binding protein [Pullulanibacillus pueri]
MSEAIIQVRHLTKRIKQKNLVEDLNFDIHRGEILGFLGPNGAGKTTTMRMMLGLTSITEGDVTIGGHSIKTEKEQALERVGGIVENPEMYKFLTGLDNLKHFQRMYRDIPDSRIADVVEMVKLTDAIKNKVKTYSLGMRQRLGIAQALLHSPDVLILDEPTNGLDPSGIRELRDYLKVLASNENIAIFISSHLLSEIEMICDRVLIIQKGKLTDSQVVNETQETQQVVAFEVDQKQKAIEVLGKTFAHLTFTEADEVLLVETDRETIPKLNATLTQHNIKVYGIKGVQKSLEDRFLELTGGNPS